MRSPLVIFNSLTTFVSLLLGFASVVQGEVIIPPEPVQPSLWWPAERFEQGLVERWTINSDTRQVAVVVNSGIWSNKDYIRRYAFIQKFGNAVVQENYSLLLQDSRQNKLAEYFMVDGLWQMDPVSLGATPFRINPSAVFGPR